MELGDVILSNNSRIFCLTILLISIEVYFMSLILCIHRLPLTDNVKVSTMNNTTKRDVAINNNALTNG